MSPGRALSRLKLAGVSRSVGRRGRSVADKAHRLPGLLRCNAQRSELHQPLHGFRRRSQHIAVIDREMRTGARVDRKADMPIDHLRPKPAMNGRPAPANAGPLDLRTRRLINLAFAIAADSEGAAHSHTRRALDEGIDADTLHHVAYLAVTTLGWPHAIRGLTWVQDLTRPKP